MGESSDTIMKWLPLSTSRGCLSRSQVKCFTNEASKLISHPCKHLKPPMPPLGGNSGVSPTSGKPEPGCQLRFDLALEPHNPNGLGHHFPKHPLYRSRGDPLHAKATLPPVPVPPSSPC